MPEPHPRERPRAYHNDSFPNSNTSYPLLQHNPQEQGPYRRDNFHIVEPSPTSQMSSSEHSFHQEFFTPEAYRNDSSGISHIGGRYLPAPSNFDEPQHGNESMPGRSATISSEGENEKAPDRKRSRIRGWTLELIGLLATLAAFISLLVVLKTVDNQPLSTWHFPFSVNTVVSTLSVIVKTPLAFVVGSCLGQGKWSWFTKRSGPLSGFVTFDDASRGPLGCAALLWWLKSRHWASLGAWVTLLLLAVDPFWQAIIQYDGKITSTEDHHSLVLTSRNLDVGDWRYESTVKVDYHSNTNVYRTYAIYPDVGMSATMLVAAVNSSISTSTRPPGISCRTGNCTWPLYTTLGICSTCLDVSEHVTTEHSVGMPDESVFSSCHSASATFVDNYTSYVLPYPGGRRVVLQNTNDYVARAACKLRSRVGLSAAFQPSDTYGFKNSETLLASLAVLELSADYWNNLTTLTQATPKATECGLELCALAYETQMTDGRPTESTVTRSTTKVPGSYDLAGDFSPEIRNFIEDDFGHDSLTEGHRAFMSGNEVPFSAVIPRYDLQVTLPQDVSLGISNPVIFNITQKSIVTMARDLYQNGTLESLTYAISNTTNVAQTFDNVARLLTYRMREADGSTASGFSEQWVVFTQVRWSLIIFPVIVLVSGYIFTIGTVLDSDRLALRTMKSDTMAALLWGLDYHARESLREEQQQYDRCSDKIAVRLTPQGTGLELRAL